MRLAGWFLLCLLLLRASAAFAQLPELPAALRGWESWVLHGEEHRRCPFAANEQPGASGAHACLLPGTLDIAVAAGRAELALEVQVELAGFLELAHAKGAWPEALSVDGRPAVVLARQQLPRVWLEPGLRRLRYQLDLSSAPETLRLPAAQRLLRLRVDGKAVFPLAREGNELWLQRRLDGADASETDEIELTVHRVLRDGLPMHLHTRIELYVSGKAREIRLGPAWPEGFELTAVGGNLPLQVEPGRILRTQAGAGLYTLSIDARARDVDGEWTWSLPAGDWPQQEILSFAADPRLRVVDVDGLVAVDPSQTQVPDEWSEYPAYALRDGDRLVLRTRSRGLADDANRLGLARQLWLDFDGGGYTVEDRIEGRLRRDFRLDLGAPFDLLSASERGDALLVTAGSGDSRGVELRYGQTRVEASARAPRRLQLPVHGWSERMDSAALTLHLPPGFRLLHAGGADRAPQAWSQRWTIYSVFIAAFLAALAYRLGGWRLALVGLAYAVLTAHEPEAPRYSLIALLLVLLAVPHVHGGSLRRLLVGAGLAAAVSLAWVGLPFALQQGRLALHPQLDTGVTADYQRDNVVQAQFSENIGWTDPASLDSAPMQKAPQAARQQSLESISVTGSRIRRADLQERYAKDAVLQVGSARPGWSWQSVRIGFDGPVESGQSLRLWLSPPAATATWRLLALLLLGVLAWGCWRARAQRRSASTLLAGLALMFCAGQASAQDPGSGAGSLPDQELLTALKQRLLRAPECAPECARFGLATLRIEGEQLSLGIEVHAGARVLVPVPLDDSALAEVGVRVDGRSLPVLGLQRSRSDAFVPIERGVHLLQLEGRVRGDRLLLDFAFVPARVELSAPGWLSSGLREQRLLAGRLELNREERSSAGAEPARPRVPIAPFVEVVREIHLNLDWSVTTRIERIAPASGGLSVLVPLIAGEQPSDAGLRVENGAAVVSLQAGERQASFSSRLPRSERIRLSAPPLSERSETWRVLVSPSFSMQSQGVPPSEPESGSDGSDVWVHEFRPLPGEVLELEISRPQAVPGATLVADKVELRSDIGARSSTHTLQLDLRATQGGNHPLRLPAGAELLALSSQGRSLNLRPEEGVLTLPIRPGQQTLLLSWREAQGAGFVTRTPELDLGLEAANIVLRMGLPGDRWLLRLHGPAVGPAVLYWSGLLVLLLLAWVVGASGRALLPTHQWLLLALGFSAYSSAALLLVGFTFLALDARQRLVDPSGWTPWRFDLMQLVLGGLTVGAFLALVSAIPSGLLGNPAMHIAGGYQGYGSLAWLADRSSGALPVASAWSLPMWVYKALMLAFALWLAQALLGWLRRSYQALSSGGGWLALRLPRLRPRPADPATPATPAAPAEGSGSTG